MNDLVLWAAPGRFQRERRIETWRRYTALQNLLHSQLQRIGELDAALGILIALESLLFVWFLDRTFTTGYTYSVVTTCFLVIPLLFSITAALTLHAEASPDAKWFLKGLDENENVTLAMAIDGAVEDFAWNLRIKQAKEAMLIFSMSSFLGLAVAYILGGMLE